MRYYSMQRFHENTESFLDVVNVYGTDVTFTCLPGGNSRDRVFSNSIAIGMPCGVYANNTMYPINITCRVLIGYEHYLKRVQCQYTNNICTYTEKECL